MKIDIDESAVGVGKTHAAIDRMIRIQGWYVFAVERVEAIHEIAERIEKASRAFPIREPMIAKVYRGNGRVGTISRQIHNIREELMIFDHAIMIITHEAMMATDFYGFDHWSLIVDEVPSMFSIHRYRTPTDVEFFEKNYTLTQRDADSRWHTVGLTPEGKALAPSAIESCDGHRYLHHFHRRCRDPRTGPVVDLASWPDMADGREWVWWSLFNPDQIEAFSSRTFLGNGFSESVSFSLFNRDDIEWTIRSSIGTRPLVRRNARIVYYTDRPTSLHYFQSDAGKSDLTLIAHHIRSSTSEPMFWSANEAARATLETHLDKAEYRTPRQAGTSSLMGYDCAAMIYAAKPSREVVGALMGLDCTEEQWVSTNEHETILQFLTRTSVRDVSSNRNVTLHVMSRDQAVYLRNFFDRQPHIAATIEKVELGLSTQVRPTRGPAKTILTAEEREAQRNAQRERNKMAMRERRAKAKVAA